MDIYLKFASLSDDMKKEVNDFIEFLKSKSVRKTTVKNRKAGLASGLVTMAQDFDAPLDDFKDYM